MEYVKLGNSDLHVSRLCLGCMGFGDPTIGQHSWTIGEEPTREIIRHSLDLGVNFFDTAIAYQLGTSEQFVGRALRDMVRREDVVVATKFLPRTDEEIQQGVSGRQHVLNSIDSSRMLRVSSPFDQSDFLQAIKGNGSCDMLLANEKILISLRIRSVSLRNVS